MGVQVNLVAESPLWHALGDEAEISGICGEAAAIAASSAPALQGFSEAERDNLSFTIVLADDAQVQELNRDFREKDKPTNVLSFPAFATNEALKASLAADYLPFEAEAGYMGDMVLAFETVAREAEEQGKHLRHHFTHLVVHSFLHLLHYDHMDEQEAAFMESLEIQILQQLSIANPYQ